MTFEKILLPAVLGLIATVVIVGVWGTNMIHLSLRTTGTNFASYAPTYPTVPTPKPAQAFWCDPQYPARWAGCNLK